VTAYEGMSKDVSSSKRTFLKILLLGKPGFRMKNSHAKYDFTDHLKIICSVCVCVCVCMCICVCVRCVYGGVYVCVCGVCMGV
jgi:hypothetical protein